MQCPATTHRARVAALPVRGGSRRLRAAPCLPRTRRGCASSASRSRGRASHRGGAAVSGFGGARPHSRGSLRPRPGRDPSSAGSRGRRGRLRGASSRPPLLGCGDCRRDVAEALARRRGLEGSRADRRAATARASRNGMPGDECSAASVARGGVASAAGVRGRSGQRRDSRGRERAAGKSAGRRRPAVLLQVAVGDGSDPTLRAVGQASVAVPALPRASSATSGFSFCGMIDEPVPLSSASRANPNSLVVHNTSSSPIRDRCVNNTAAA